MNTATMNKVMKKTILILGGSSEGFALAEKLEAHPAYQPISSLAGRTSLPRKPVGNYRTGGFGGPEGLANYIKTENIFALIDATHPFAHQISSNANIAAKNAGCPIIHISRPEWQKQTGDNWIEVNSMQQAASALTPEKSPAFLTIGRLELSAFLHRDDISFFCRAIEAPKQTDPQKQKISNPMREDEWPDNFNFIYAKGPFSYRDEKSLFEEHNFKTIITKNSGGEKARAKLDVARDLGLPVIMINRHKTPGDQTVQTIDEALNWLENL